MPKINPEVESFTRIKVIGVGGSGGNAINHMVNSKIGGVEFIAMNTDNQDLQKSLASKKVHLGKNLAKGLGTGMNPEIGKRAAEETIEEIQSITKGADMVFVACGMGGGTGTGASPVIAKTAKEQGSLTIGVVTKPFFFEGAQRMRLANEGLERLRNEVDALIVIPNDRILSIIDKSTSCLSAFAMCDEILRQAVEGISDLITTPGIINVDFADIKAVMQNAGSALMGIGSASGENRAEEAAKIAISSPLLDISIEGARGVLFAIAGGDDMTMFEIQEAAKIITESIDPDAKVIFGAIKDTKLKKDEIKVTVIATGFPDDKRTIATKEKIVDTKQTSSEVKTPENKESIKPVTTEQASTIIKKEETSTPIAPATSPHTEIADTVKEEEEEDDEDKWSSVPAFLRRSRK